MARIKTKQLWLHKDKLLCIFILSSNLFKTNFLVNDFLLGYPKSHYFGPFKLTKKEILNNFTLVDDIEI